MTLPDPNEIIINQGLISRNNEYTEDVHDEEQTFGLYEFHDLLAVAYGRKPLAIMWIMDNPHHTSEGYSQSNIQEIFDLCAENGVHALTYTGAPHCYDTIFYCNENRAEAYKLAAVLWELGHEELDRTFYHFTIGYLLGYLVENIVQYFRHNDMPAPTNEQLHENILRVRGMKVPTEGQLRDSKVEFHQPYKWTLRFRLS